MFRRLIACTLSLVLLLASFSALAVQAEFALGGFTLELPQSWELVQKDGYTIQGDDMLIRLVGIEAVGLPAAYIEEKIGIDNLKHFLEEFWAFTHDDAVLVEGPDSIYGVYYSDEGTVKLELYHQYDVLVIQMPGLTMNQAKAKVDSLMQGIRWETTQTGDSAAGITIGGLHITPPTGWRVTSVLGGKVEFYTAEGSVGITLEDASAMGVTEEMVKKMGPEWIGEALVLMLQQNIQQNASEIKASGIETTKTGQGISAVLYWNDNLENVRTGFVCYGTALAVIVSSCVSNRQAASNDALMLIEHLEPAALE